MFFYSLQFLFYNRFNTKCHLVGEYGWPARGGSNLILVKGVYLGLFHSVCMYQKPATNARTYFMGAITLCPHYPFHIHKITRFPILKDMFYKGTYTYSVAQFRIDYVMFGVGITMDPNSTEHVLISFGHQDGDGYIIKMNINELYDNMKLVSHCSNMNTTRI